MSESSATRSKSAITSKSVSLKLIWDIGLSFLFEQAFKWYISAAHKSVLRWAVRVVVAAIRKPRVNQMLEQDNHIILVEFTIFIGDNVELDQDDVVILFQHL